MYIINDNCIACGTCAEECPVSCISEGEKYLIDQDECISCGTCQSVCPNNAVDEKQIAFLDKRLNYRRCSYVQNYRELYRMWNLC